MIWYRTLSRGTDNSDTYGDTCFPIDAKPTEIRPKSIHMAQFPYQIPSELFELLPGIDT